MVASITNIAAHGYQEIEIPQEVVTTCFMAHAEYMWNEVGYYRPDMVCGSSLLTMDMMWSVLSLRSEFPFRFLAHISASTPLSDSENYFLRNNKNPVCQQASGILRR